MYRYMAALHLKVHEDRKHAWIGLMGSTIGKKEAEKAWEKARLKLVEQLKNSKDDSNLEPYM